MNKKKKIFIMVTLSLFALGVLSFGTYALYNMDLLTDNNSILTGQVKMSYSESNEIILNNVVPTSDNKGISSTNYFEFKVNTYIKTNKEMTMNYNIVLEPLNVDSSYTKFNDSDIKVYLTKVENNTETLVTGPITIDELNQYVLKSQEETFNKNDIERSTTYRLRAWLDYNFDASKINEKTYSYKFRVNVNNEAAPKEIVPILNIPVGTDGIEKVTHEIDSTLQVNSKFATEYRYRGGDSVVKNYVTFNNETWRIIGIIPTEDTDGKVENRIKIIRNESIGGKEWNSCEESNHNYKCNDSNKYLNDWTGATLNTYLNNDYYNTLTTNVKSMIGTTKYYLGGCGSSLNFMSDTMWRYERKKANDTDGTYYHDTSSIMQNDASKKIALMYVSDYGYAASKECTSALVGYDKNKMCVKDNNWLNFDTDVWLLNASVGDGASVYMFWSDGFIEDNRVSLKGGSEEWAVFPTLTLSSNVKISGGTGTNSDPYQLSL